MLSEERIKELARDATLDVYRECFDAYDLVETVADEATAAERERLMEEVCSNCGSGSFYPHLVGGGVLFTCDKCECSEKITRAEYLRLHQEST